MPAWWAEVPEIDAWLDGIPDLDREDGARLEVRIAAASALGMSEGDLVAARRITVGLTVVSLACSAIALFTKGFAELLVALWVLPVVAVAIALMNRGHYTLRPRWTIDPRPPLLGVLAPPGLVLTFRGLADVAMLDHVGLIFSSVLLGVVLGLLAARFEADPMLLRSTRSWLVVLATLHVAGPIMLANRTLDDAEPRTFRVEVVGHRVAGRSPPTTYVQLAPWGPTAEVTEHEISHLGERSAVGEVVCIDLHPGAFGARWYAIRACE